MVGSGTLGRTPKESGGRSEEGVFRFDRAVVVAGVGVWGAALVAPGVAAANPACGATVKHNVTLTGDMDCSASASSGIVIGKAGITINLNGHTLTGPNDGSYYGIDNSSGYDKVTVENGTVKNYEYDVLYEYTDGRKDRARQGAWRVL